MSENDDISNKHPVTCSVNSNNCASLDFLPKPNLLTDFSNNEIATYRVYEEIIAGENALFNCHTYLIVAIPRFVAKTQFVR